MAGRAAASAAATAASAAASSARSFSAASRRDASSVAANASSGGAESPLYRGASASSGYTCGIERYAAVASGSDPATPPGSDATSDEAGGAGGGGALPYTASNGGGAAAALSSKARATVAGLASSSSCTVAALSTPLSFIMRVNSSLAIVFSWCTCPSAVAGRTRSSASHGDAALRQHGSTGAANGSQPPPAPVHLCITGAVSAKAPCATYGASGAAERTSTKTRVRRSSCPRLLIVPGSDWHRITP